MDLVGLLQTKCFEIEAHDHDGMGFKTRKIINDLLLIILFVNDGREQVVEEVGRMALRQKTSLSKWLCENIPFDVSTENVIILDQILRESISEVNLAKQNSCQAKTSVHNMIKVVYANEVMNQIISAGEIYIRKKVVI